jgi:hypothetical protein
MKNRNKGSTAAPIVANSATLSEVNSIAIDPALVGGNMRAGGSANCKNMGSKISFVGM